MRAGIEFVVRERVKGNPFHIRAGIGIRVVHVHGTRTAFDKGFGKRNDTRARYEDSRAIAQSVEVRGETGVGIHDGQSYHGLRRNWKVDTAAFLPGKREAFAKLRLGCPAIS